jgi:hypothetical protein
MYGRVNAVLRSKAAMWGVMLFAIVLFCVTAAFAFGMGTGKKSDAQQPDQAGKIPSTRSSVSGLQVQSSSGTASSTQLQGQNNGSVSQPAAPASVAPNAGLDIGINASQMQASASAAVGPASTGLSASLQPSADLDGNGSTNVQAGLNALGANLKLNAQLP